MRKYQALDLKELHWTGRTIRNEGKRSVGFDWTDSGFSFAFEGTCLLADFHVKPYEWEENIIDDVQQQVQRTPRTDWPWVIVLLGDADKPYRKFQLNHETGTYLLFSSDKPESHRIRVIRLNEAAFYQIDLLSLQTDGTIGEDMHVYDGHIEFIGDSITCGFGIATNTYNRLFYGIDQDGWETYAMRTARALNLEPEMTCVSGITLCSGYQWMPYIFGMDQVYPVKDYFRRDTVADAVATPEWNHSASTQFVVINLGTNDATGICKMADQAAGIDRFRTAYKEFVELIRRTHGPQTKIICTLGCMDYYLYDIIRETAELIRADGDTNVYFYKFMKAMPDSEDIGSLGHPTYVRHKKMGNELTGFLAHFMDEGQ